MASRRLYRLLYDRVLSRVYDLYMGWYMLPFGGERRFRHGMLEGLCFAPGERILDCTCGTGSCTAAVRESAERAFVVGSDLSLGQLRRARHKPALARVPLLEADASRLPFRDRSFDSVFVPHAVHEMPRELRGAVFREARRVCGPDGRLVVLELDRPRQLWLRALLGLWFLYWIPPPLNFETRTRRDLQRRGLCSEVAEAGFGRVTKCSRYAGTMQVIEARP
jgi:demethylmenaquinone methyltransferase/2-methoxy-6-polyprenyl-1,4-benzoquinol methylase